MKRAKTLITFLPLLHSNPKNSRFHPLSYPQFLLKFHNFHQLGPSSTEPICNNPILKHPSSNSVDFFTVCETLSSYSNDYKRALDFFTWVESNCGFEHNTETYNSMIDILGKFFEFEKCLDLIQNMRKSASSMPNYLTFVIMFKRYVSARYIQEAIDMFHKLDEFNLKDETSFCNLIDALCEHKHVIEAEDFWVNQRSCVKFVNKTKVYNMMLHGYAKMEWWGKCREFWEEMDRKGVKKDLVSYSIYMDIQCKCGKPWKAVKMYKEMRKMRMVLDVVAYNIVIHAIGVKDGVDFSIRLLREMIERRCPPNVVTYNTIIKLLCDNERMKEAYCMLHEMKKKGCEPNVITYHCFFRCIVKPNELLTLFERMLESGVQPLMDTYVMLMRKFGKWGFLRPVLHVWDKMMKHGISPNQNAYIALIDALVEKGMMDMARKYDQEMLARGLSGKSRVGLEETKVVNGDSGVSSF